MPPFKIEHLIPVVAGICTVAGTVLVTWNNGNVRSALSEDRMISLTADVKAIKESLASVPLYAQRLTQLEAWMVEQKGFNGALDGRLRVAEDTIARHGQDVDNIKRASGVKLRN